jgi:hypothetical protein
VDQERRLEQGMTKAEWDEIKQTLSFPWGAVTLLVDGFTLTLQVKRVSDLKFEIFPYVNGEFKGSWGLNKTEEAVRFLRPKTLHLYSPTQKAKITKGLSKKLIKEWFPDLDKKKTYYSWGWSSFASLKAHLIKHNKSIEMAPSKEKSDV